MGYPPEGGRFDTRSAPVRHSSSGCKQPMLPSDLHVLGLPLAFILSQDQTLHRIIVYNYPTPEPVRPKEINLCFSLILRCRIPICQMNFFSYSSGTKNRRNQPFFNPIPALLYQQSGCKYITVFFIGQTVIN